MSAKALPVLMYHHVSPAAGLVTVSPETFAAQMRGLAERGWRGVGLADLARFMAGEPLPERSVVISFDDGYLDNWQYAHPILQETGLLACMFVVTDWLGNGAARPAQGAASGFNHKACMQAVQDGRHDDVMMRWAEVEAAQAAGTFEFHSHTHTHTRWDRACPSPHEKRDRLAEDLARSRAALTAQLGSVSDHLCWPQGYFDADYIEVAQAAGFRYLHTTQAGTVESGGDPLRIPRIVTKDRAGSWLNQRLRVYQSPLLARGYGWLKGLRWA